jgi:hypothetical protein
VLQLGLESNPAFPRLGFYQYEDNRMCGWRGCGPCVGAGCCRQSGQDAPARRAESLACGHWITVSELCRDKKKKGRMLSLFCVASKQSVFRKKKKKAEMGELTGK